MLGRFLFYSLRLSFVCMLGAGIWLGGLVLFTSMIPSSAQDQESVTDGIVIFTGGKTRLSVALSLFEAGKSQYLLISGVNPESNFPQMVSHLSNKSNITLGYDALDTVGNAGETAKWARDHNIKSIRLITSNYHMPRSLFELRRTLPDVRILPHPVVGKSFLESKWWLDLQTLTLVIQEYNKFIFAFVRRIFEDSKEYLNNLVRR